MKPGKVIDKTKGPVKVAAVTSAAKKPVAKKRADSTKVKAAALPPCLKGHPVIWVHYNSLSAMRKWCGTCLEVQQ